MMHTLIMQGQLGPKASPPVSNHDIRHRADQQQPLSRKCPTESGVLSNQSAYQYWIMERADLCPCSQAPPTTITVPCLLLVHTEYSLLSALTQDEIPQHG